MTNPPPFNPYAVQPAPNYVVVTDVDMTIGAMCKFMVKWAIASIPAILIITILMFLAFSVLAGMFGGLMAGLGSSHKH